MPARSTAWKAFERAIAKMVGGQRRGAHTGSGTKGSGKSDVILEGFSLECKLLKSPSQADYYGALAQAMQAREDFDDIPVAFVAKAGSPYGNAMGVMRFSDFVNQFTVAQWIAPSGNPIIMMRAEDMGRLIKGEE